MFHGHLDYFQKPPLGRGPNTKPLGDHGTPNAHYRWFILFHHVRGPAQLKIHWSSIWSKTRSHMTSHYTRGSVTTLHDFGGALGQPLDTFFWALTISWARLLAHVWSGPKKQHCVQNRVIISRFNSDAKYVGGGGGWPIWSFRQWDIHMINWLHSSCEFGNHFACIFITY